MSFIASAASAIGSFVATNAATIVAVTGAVAGAAGAAYTASAAADAQKQQANYQAAIDKNNAQIAEWNRADALNRGEIDVQNAMRDRAALLGTQRARMAASGVDISQGSPLDILSGTEFLGQTDIATIRSNAAREAWGYTVDKGNKQASADFNAAVAKKIKPGQQSAIAGSTSLLNSATSYAMAKAK